MLAVFLQYSFLRYALIIGLLVGFLAPVLGVFIVMRRQALITDALSHITLTGIAFHLLMAQSLTVLQPVNPVYMGMGFSVTGSLLLERLRHVYASYKELAVPIILSSGIGFGVVFLSLADEFGSDLFRYLFGSIIAVTSQDALVVSLIAVIVILFIIFFYKELFFLSFDEEQAKINGIPTKTINFLFTVIAALVIASSIRIVGILLVSSLMILPVAASVRLSKSFKQMFVYAFLFGELSVAVGLLTAFYFDVAPGGMIALTALLILGIVIGLKKETH
ncbi:metal ABC transporter permease [Bacillus piscicola]|uniref:metal ABC transporter permease n=1 Tax=Bacillus piscicola TaxID=1632684 RepID=UPI001F0951EB|nr:metal ABC transporter permease [Bacillus piscicola]